MNLGERLKSARKRAGLSLRALGERAGVSAQAISKYERGLDVPGSEVLIRLAKALEISLEWLLRPRPVETQLVAPAYRSHRSLLGTRQRAQIEAQVEEWLERYLTLEDILGEQLSFVLPEIPRKIEQEEDAEDVADVLRRAWNLGEDAIPDLIATIEAQGIRVGIVSGPDHFDALMFSISPSEPVMIVKSDVPGDRQRLSLAHELGHLILEIPEEWDERNMEKAAYRFAAAFLAPRAAVRRELGASRARLDWYELHLLKHRYGMSMQAWIHRAHDLGIISPTTAQESYRLFREQGWHRQEPGDPYPPERTTRLERLVLRALMEEIIGEQRAAELLGRSLDTFLEEVRRQHDDFPLLLRA